MQGSSLCSDCDQKLHRNFCVCGYVSAELSFWWGGNRCPFIYIFRSWVMATALLPCWVETFLYHAIGGWWLLLTVLNAGREGWLLVSDAYGVTSDHGCSCRMERRACMKGNTYGVIHASWVVPDYRDNDWLSERNEIHYSYFMQGLQLCGKDGVKQIFIVMFRADPNPSRRHYNHLPHHSV